MMMMIDDSYKNVFLCDLLVGGFGEEFGGKSLERIIAHVQVHCVNWQIDLF